MPPEVTPPRLESPDRNGFSEILIEIGDEMNRQVMFGPTQERLRGRWDSHNLQLGDTSSVGLMQMPTIPGMYVSVDVRNRRGAIIDPLSLPENSTLLAKISESHHGIFSRACKECTTVVKEEMSDDELATWVYWMMRAVGSKSARLLKGELPGNEKDILRAIPKSKIRKDFYNSLLTADK